MYENVKSSQLLKICNINTTELNCQEKPGL